MTRREQREQAFLIIYQRMFGGGEDILTEKECSLWDYEESEFTTALVNGVEEKAEELDAIISSHLKGWTIGRISKISKAVLRLCIYEMKYLGTPASVAANEAVELTKIYSDAPDPSFVNGVISSVVKEK